MSTYPPKYPHAPNHSNPRPVAVASRTSGGGLPQAQKDPKSQSPHPIDAGAGRQAGSQRHTAQLRPAGDSRTAHSYPRIAPAFHSTTTPSRRRRIMPSSRSGLLRCYRRMRRVRAHPALTQFGRLAPGQNGRSWLLRRTGVSGAVVGATVLRLLRLTRIGCKTATSEALAGRNLSGRVFRVVDCDWG